MKKLLINILSPMMVVFFMAILLGSCKDEDESVVGLCPIVLTTNPLDGANAVPLNQVISATFNEALNPATITQESLSLQGGNSSGRGNAEVAGNVSYDNKTFTLSFTPNDNLDANIVYTALIPANIKDLAGNVLQAPYEWVFATGIAPYVTNTSPANLDVSVVANKVITAVFSEAMVPASITSSSFLLKADTVVIPGVVSYVGTTATFTPTNDLKGNTLYTATITKEAKNLANNVALSSDYLWSFTTALSSTIITTDPEDLATNVSLNQAISATFSTEMDPLTITAASFKLDTGSTQLAGVVSYTDSTAIFTPSVDLVGDKTYTATITTAAKNTSGMGIENNFVWTFTTSPPSTVISTIPLDLATNVSLNQTISATFSSAMDPLSITALSFKLDTGTTSLAGVISYIDSTATFNPSVDLVDGTIYTATLTVAVENPSGVAMENEYVWSFTAVTLPPSVVLTDPTNLATNVPLDKVISATFRTPMNPSTITTTSFKLATGATQVAGAVNYSGSIATFTPTVDLISGASYTATITTAVKNPSGVAMLSNFAWNFTAATPSTVISTDPIDLAANVSLNKAISATFSTPMDPLTITASSFKLVTGATQVAGTISYSGSTATFTPTANLLSGASYTATITTDVKNQAGIAMVNNKAWTFSTSAASTIISTDPIHLATNVNLNKVISATFSSPMDPSTITTSSFKLVTGATQIGGVVNYSGSTATFTPSADLVDGASFTATITTAVKNLAGIAIESNHVWTFSTAAVPPTVLSTDPINLATNVNLNKVVRATFSSPMDPLTITTSSFKLVTGATQIGGVVDYSGSTATFTPSANLPDGASFTATITTAAKNQAGVAIESNYEWTFSTTAVAPTVTSTDPLDLATGVPLNKVISATFSKAMDPSTINTTNFTLFTGGASVSGSVNYSGSTATFTPNSDLIAGNNYTAMVTNAVKDLGSVAMTNDYQWTFKALDTPPTVQSTDPMDLATNVPLNQVVTASFSTEMDQSTINSSSFTLFIGANQISGSVTYLGTTATFTPNSNLLSGETITATITTAAKNLAGTSMVSNYVWNFTTVDPLGPAVVDLKSLLEYGIIAGVGISNNAGPSEIHDMNVGISPGVRSSITGFPPAIIVNGAIHASDDATPVGIAALLLQAKQDLVDAYNFAFNATSPAPAVAPADLGGTTLAPGIWTSATTMLLQNGDLTLDAQGDANAVWIFQIGSSFTSVGIGPFPSSTGGNVILAGGAKAGNVFWVCGASATIGDFTSFKGNILALSDITMNSGAKAEGRMLARNGTVILTSTNIITRPVE